MKLSLSILILAVPIFVITQGVLYKQSRDNIQGEALNKTKTALKMTGMRVIRCLNTAKDAAEINASLIEDDFTPDTITSCTRRVVQLNGNINKCSIKTEANATSDNLYFYAYSSKSEDSIITIAKKTDAYIEKTWYDTPAILGRSCWLSPLNDAWQDKNTPSSMNATYCRPFYSKKTNKLIGVMAVELSLSKIANIITSEKPYPNAYFFMLGKDGNYFVHPDTTRLLRKTIFHMAQASSQPSIIALGHEMTTGMSGSLEVEINGEPCLVCYRPIPDTPWSIALVTPLSDIYKEYHYFTYIMIPFIIVGFLIIMLIGYRLGAQVVRPINKLLQQSKLIARGHYKERIPQSQGVDVIGDLQNSFSAMQQSLEKHITDINRMNDETKKRNEELQVAQKKAEEGSLQKLHFMQNMTHQIRTPLNILMGFSQVLEDSSASLPPEEMKSILRAMHHNARLINRMLLMLYDSSEMGESEEKLGQYDETIDCFEAAQDGITITHRFFPEIPLKLDYQLPEHFITHGNWNYLIYSIRELLYNAARFSSGEQINLRVISKDNAIQFIIEDKGPGIHEDYREDMFEPFTKANPLSEGLGLGLPLCKRHARNLGGDLILDCSYQEGCRFIFSIPIR